EDVVRGAAADGHAVVRVHVHRDVRDLQPLEVQVAAGHVEPVRVAAGRDHQAREVDDGKLTGIRQVFDPVAVGGAALREVDARAAAGGRRDLVGAAADPERVARVRRVDALLQGREGRVHRARVRIAAGRRDVVLGGVGRPGGERYERDT